MPRGSDAKRIDEILAQATSRPAIKRLGAWLDDDGAALRPLLIEHARNRGIDLPDEALCWPGKRLIRLALGREEEARRRLNPIHVDESFTCAACGAEVPPGGRTPRDHCPFCLRSLHVDEVPGDRASACAGIMDPVALTIGGRAEGVITYRCRRCGMARQNRVMTDGTVPDDPAALRQLAASSDTVEPTPRRPRRGRDAP